MKKTNFAETLAQRSTGGCIAADLGKQEGPYPDEWKWDGQSVEAIQAHADKCGYADAGDLLDSWPDMSTGWAASVPEQHRGSVLGRIDESGDEHYAEILAVDQQGQALVNELTCYPNLNAQNGTARVMPMADAMALVDQYRDERAQAENAAALRI